MDCERVRELIQESLERKLSAGEEAALSEHLAVCAKCAKERSAFSALHNLLLGQESSSVSAGFTELVLQRTEEARKREIYVERRNVRLVVLLSAAAVLLAAIFLPLVVDMSAVFEEAGSFVAGAFEPRMPAVEAGFLTAEISSALEFAARERGFAEKIPSTILILFSVVGAGALVSEVTYIVHRRRRKW